MLQPGDPAPPFRLSADRGRMVDSQSLAGQAYVLYFYPRDDTPGCTKEACAFRDMLPAFEDLGVPLFGVSGDTVAAHDKFVRKYDLNFPLLSDPQHQLIEAYGVWVEKNMYGRKSFGVRRSTFVIGADGTIHKSWPKVRPEQHAAEVAAYLADVMPAATPPAQKR